jgi:hypothetical protein
MQNEDYFATLPRLLLQDIPCLPPLLYFTMMMMEKKTTTSVRQHFTMLTAPLLQHYGEEIPMDNNKSDIFGRVSLHSVGNGNGY